MVYVAPEGAHAGSAGTFITAAAHIAVMAPGTNIGAATPVGEGRELPEAVANKATNDAAALMRSIAQARGRNAEKLEETVRSAASFTATEARDSGVVDLIAPDLPALLAAVNGRTVATAADERTFQTQNLAVREMELGLLGRLLTFLANPNISFLLLVLGGLGIVIELINPGLIAPGVTGAILLVLAFLGFGNLPANWAGIILILLALVLAVLEFYVSSAGVLGVGAIASFVLGSFLLFAQFGPAPPTLPPVRISPWVLFPTVIAVAGGGGWVLWTMVRSARRHPEEERGYPLLGAVGLATTDLTPRGSVQVRGELWSAVAKEGVIEAGRTVRVVGASGMVLTVARNEEPVG